MPRSGPTRPADPPQLAHQGHLIAQVLQQRRAVAALPRGLEARDERAQAVTVGGENLV